jgi:uncharacterized protein YycO
MAKVFITLFFSLLLGAQLLAQQATVAVKIVNKKSSYKREDSIQLQVTIDNAKDSVGLIFVSEFKKDGKWLTDKLNLLYGTLVNKAYAIYKNGTYTITVATPSITNLLTFNSHDDYRIKVQCSPLAITSAANYFIAEAYTKSFGLRNR